MTAKVDKTWNFLKKLSIIVADRGGSIPEESRFTIPGFFLYWAHGCKHSIHMGDSTQKTGLHIIFAYRGLGRYLSVQKIFKWQYPCYACLQGSEQPCRGRPMRYWASISPNLSEGKFRLKLKGGRAEKKRASNYTSQKSARIWGTKGVGFVLA